MPEISIIMPVYNKEKYLRDSLESVINQTFSDFELIVINDGSTDHSLDVIREYAAKDSRIKYFSQDNRGVSAARNHGLDRSSGKWIQFLDGDDLICKHYLSSLFSENGIDKYDICFSGMEVIDTIESTKKTVGINSDMKEIDQNTLLDTFMEQQFIDGYFGYLSNKLIRKDFLDYSDVRFPEHINLAEDLYFMVELYRNAGLMYVSETIGYQYFIRENNFAFRKKINYYHQIEVMLLIRKWIIQSDQKDLYLETINKKISEYCFAVLFDANEDGKLRENYLTLIGNEEIMTCLQPTLVSGFRFNILSALKTGNISRIKLLFRARNTIRYFYRIFMKRKSVYEEKSTNI